MAQQTHVTLAACIQACLDCYRHCQQTALGVCLERGGRHAEPAHLRLMLDCAEVCRSAAALMLSESPFHADLCGLCAEVCEACAASCAHLDDMQDCQHACEHCAETCRQMARPLPAARPGRSTVGRHAHP